MPKVSIGMPVYNGEKYIKESLNSLLVQSFDDFEMIISDNASFDATSEICRDYASRDSRILYIRQSANISAIENFEYVLNMASGEYFMWAAHDDLWDANWIHSMLSLLQDRGDVLAFGSLQRIDALGRPIHQPGQREKFNFSGNMLWRRLKFYVSNPGAGKANSVYGLIKTNTLREIPFGSFRNYKYGADMLLIYALLRRVSIVSPEIHSSFYKRIHNDAASLEIAANNLRKHRFLRVSSMFFSLIEPFHRFVCYTAYSGIVEITLMFILMPFTFVSVFIFIAKRRFLTQC